MAIKHLQEDGTEIEVFTAEEVAAKAQEAATAARTEVEGTYKPQVETLTSKLTEAEKRAAQRAAEFREFRRLSDEQKAELSEKDRIIYENQLRLEEERVAREEEAKTRQEAIVDSALKKTAGSNEQLYTKMKELWPNVNIAASTPEEIELKTRMVLGMISTTQPDLVASINGFSGSGGYTPPSPARREGDSYADTDAGKAAAAELGLVIEVPKKDQ